MNSYVEAFAEEFDAEVMCKTNEEIEQEKQRTSLQNKSLHKWLELLAQELNDAGFSQNDKQVILKDVPFTKENLKEDVLKPYMNYMYPDITSTAKLSTTKIQKLYEAVDAVISERTGVHVEWPSDQPPMVEERG